VHGSFILGIAIAAGIGYVSMAILAAALACINPYDYYVRDCSSGCKIGVDWHFSASLRAGNVFNDYNFGGYLIAHHVLTFIDGRGVIFGDLFRKYLTGKIPTTTSTATASLGHYCAPRAICPTDGKAYALTTLRSCGGRDESVSLTQSAPRP